METLKDLDIVRAVSLTTLLRADDGQEDEATDDDSAMPVMVVRFSPFDVWYEIDSFWEGNFLERTVRGAFAKTIKENGSQVKVLFNHGRDFSIGDKLLGIPENLREDADAAALDAQLFDTSYNRDLLPGLRAGGYGASFMFRVIRDEMNEEPGKSAHNPKGIPERTIKEVRLFEAGPVTWPANPDATAGVRSMTDEYYEGLRSRDPQRYDELRSRVLELRTPKADAAPDQGTSVDGAAPATPDAPEPEEPREIHPEGMSIVQRAAYLRELYLAQAERIRL